MVSLPCGQLGASASAVSSASRSPAQHLPRAVLVSKHLCSKTAGWTSRHVVHVRLGVTARDRNRWHASCKPVQDLSDQERDTDHYTWNACTHCVHQRAKPCGCAA